MAHSNYRPKPIFRKSLGIQGLSAVFPMISDAPGQSDTMPLIVMSYVILASVRAMTLDEVGPGCRVREIQAGRRHHPVVLRLDSARLNLVEIYGFGTWSDQGGLAESRPVNIIPLRGAATVRMGVPARLDGVDLLPCNGARSSFQETLNVTAVAAKACCRQGLPRRRHLARPLGPPRDRDRRDRDARPHGHPRGVRLAPAPQGRSHHRLAPHDHPDGRPDRDAQGPRRRGPLGLVQHLLDPGSCRRRHRRRRHPRLRLQGRVPRRSTGNTPTRSSSGPTAGTRT